MGGEEKSFKEKRGEIRGFIFATISFIILLYFLPMVVNIFVFFMNLSMVLFLSFLYLIALTFILIYYIPKNILMLTLERGRYIVYHEISANKQFVLDVGINWSRLATSILLLLLYFTIANNFLNIGFVNKLLLEFIKYLVIYLIIIFFVSGMLPGSKNVVDSTPRKYYENARKHAFILISLLFLLLIAFTLLVNIPWLGKAVGDLLKSMGLLWIIGDVKGIRVFFVGFVITPLIISAVLNGVILGWYYKNFRKIGLVITFPAFLAVLTSISAIYFLGIFVRLVLMEPDTFLKILSAIEKMIFVIFGSILLLLYLNRRVQETLTPPLSGGSFDEQSFVEGLVDVVKVFTNDFINKIVLYNLFWIIFRIVYDLLDVDPTSQLLATISKTLLGQAFSQSVPSPVTILHYSLLIFLMFLTITFTLLRILDYLNELGEKAQIPENTFEDIIELNDFLEVDF